MPNAENAVHIGHRERMRRKFLRSGDGAFDSYELLEMLLYSAIPYQDTNPIAHRLISKFKTLYAVFHATKEDLMTVEGVGPSVADFLLQVGEFAEECFIFTEDAPGFDNYKTAEEYFIRYFEGKTSHETVMLMLDNKMCYLGFEVIAECDFSTSTLRPKPFLEKALLKGASVVMVAHNHPMGPFFPTESDRAGQSSLKSAMEYAGIVLAEHFLVCGHDAIGLCSHTSSAVRQYPALSRFEKSASDERGGTFDEL